VTAVDLKTPAATQLLAKAEYLITVATDNETSTVQWQSWVEAIQGLDAIWWEQKTKSGKTQMINLRDRLFELNLVETELHQRQKRHPRFYAM
jgi:uncharacterized protein (DUF2344 family)